MVTDTVKELTFVQVIDNAIKTISGRELVSSAEMVDLLLDLRSHNEAKPETPSDI